MNYNEIKTNSYLFCPRCGGNHLEYQMRLAETKGNANYYHIHSGKSWIIPSWQKTYKSERNYKSVALCKDCGYCFEPYPKKGFLYYFFCLLILPLALGYLFFTSKWFKINKKQFFRIAGITVAVGFILTIILYFIGINIPDPTV
ncbi:MAG: hypothetical protein IKI29_04605 [Clostridia bacterium]|nr:hypothetical protein [Clostridia bacterium]